MSVACPDCKGSGQIVNSNTRLALWGKLRGSARSVKPCPVCGGTGRSSVSAPPVLSQSHTLTRTDLNQRFGLTFRGNGWAYEGRADDSQARDLRDAHICLLVMKHMRAKLPFRHVCVLAGSPVALVADAQEPFCMVTSLNGDATGELIASAIRDGGQLILEDNGAFVLKLPE